jgi:hypothetical protein
MIDLKKKVGIVLEKRKVAATTMAQVGCAFDITGSMRGLYQNGTVQSLAERLLAVALRFDDNGTLDSWSFCDGSDELTPITEKNFANYVNEEMVNNRNISKWNGTNYAPVLRDIAGFYFGMSKEVITERQEKATSFLGKLFGKTETVRDVQVVTSGGQNDGKLPVYLMFITDGENFDGDEAWAVLEALKTQNIYVEFVGVGPETFKFCRKAADAFGNVGFVQIKNVDTISDEELYSSLLNEEFCTWIKK